jgi:sterol desaturase/sphingolipid hydroxylase (fatty acid hydroxylase superfamily)
VLHRFVPNPLQTFGATLPIGWRFFAALVVGEVGCYWAHRWMHEIPVLWRLHAIHHSAEEIDYLVNTKAHPLDLVFTRILGFIPMFALGLVQPTQNPADPVSLGVMLTGTVWQFFIHANVRWRFGWLEYLVSTPAFHHWHHTRHDHINRNYSTVLPWMDMVFGTYYLPRNRWPDAYGIGDYMPPDIPGQLLHVLHPGETAAVSSEVIQPPPAA